MTEGQNRSAPGPRVPGAVRRLPRLVTSGVVASLSALVLACTYWLATNPAAADAQTGFIRWVNDPPQPFAALLAATNSVLGPVPLTLVAGSLLAWIMVTARGNARWEVLRAMGIGFVLSEVVTQVLKRLADQPRPTASIPGLDVHGYPKDPYGNTFPSARTSVAVGLVSALWPWLTGPQRVVGGPQPPWSR